jgi:hypothetical protein
MNVFLSRWFSLTPSTSFVADELMIEPVPSYTFITGGRQESVSGIDMPIQCRNHPLAIVLLTVLIAVIAIPAQAASLSAPSIDGVSVFPSDHIWNTRADSLPVDSHSADYVHTIGTTAYLHPDFGSGTWDGTPIGIPYMIVSGSQQKSTVIFDYADESDPGPYPIPANPLIEGGSDHHMLIVDRDASRLYELYAAERQTDGSWHAGSGAIYDLSGYLLRPKGLTSADAAGLAILPGLVRYEEVAAGEINHAIRFTAPSTQRAYVWPARHYASSLTSTAYPPMGQRFRLKSSFDTTGYPYQARVVLEALKKYGMILADNGAPWYIGGVPDERWDNDALHTLQQLKGSDFEAVDSSSLMISPDSGQARVKGSDTIPPRGITNLVNTTYLQNSIRWTWTDPVDPDFDRVMVYLNGIWKMNVTKGTGAWNATGLVPDTSYTIGTRTVDSSGNLNTSWVNHTARTTARTTGAPIVSSITPGSGATGTTVQITDLHGSQFMPGPTGTTVRLVMTGKPDILASGVSVTSSDSIRCAFAIPANATAGPRDVVVSNPDLQSGILPNGFSVVTPSLSITSLTPNSGRHGTSVQIKNVAGTNFRTGASIKLEKTGYPIITGKNIRVVSPTGITCTFAIPASARTGLRDVTVTNPDGKKSTLVNGFRVLT